MSKRGTLQETEQHPAVVSALEYYNSLTLDQKAM